MSNANRTPRYDEANKPDFREDREQSTLGGRNKGQIDNSDPKHVRGAGGGSGDTKQSAANRRSQVPEMQERQREDTRSRQEGYRDAEFTGRERITESPPTLRLD